MSDNEKIEEIQNMPDDKIVEGVYIEEGSNEEKEPINEPEKNDNLTDERDFTRCSNCSRKTQGKEDYINKKNGKITKTCLKCRESVKKSLAKIKQKHNPVKPLKLSDCVSSLMEIMKRADIELNEEEQSQFLKVLQKTNTLK